MAALRQFELTLTPLCHSRPLKAQQRLGVGLGWLCKTAGTPPLLTHQFQAEPCRCSRRVASIIECIDLCCAINLMRVLISLTAPLRQMSEGFPVCNRARGHCPILVISPEPSQNIAFERIEKADA
jgi:hypothetical protein